MEVAHAKGSARLLHLSVAGSMLVAGETFAADTLHALLTQEGRSALLLYPELAGEAALGLASPAPLAPGLTADPTRILLVVLDATWRKSRKMLYLNPQLQALPRLPLRAPPPSNYLIRKAHAPNQLSTLEASCHALAQLENAPARYAPLLDSFGRFVACYQNTGGTLAR